MDIFNKPSPTSDLTQRNTKIISHQLRWYTQHEKSEKLFNWGSWEPHKNENYPYKIIYITELTKKVNNT